MENRTTTGRLSPSTDSVVVSVDLANVLLNPPEQEVLVVQPGIGQAIGLHEGASQPPKSSKPVVSRDQDGCVIRGFDKGPPIVEGPGIHPLCTERICPSVEPDGYGQWRLGTWVVKHRTRHIDVKEETVFSSTPVRRLSCMRLVGVKVLVRDAKGTFTARSSAIVLVK